MSNFLKTLSLNEVGRDFVIGDLHGQLDLLHAFMDHVKFSNAFDRIISVGDLVDRGESNLECLQLLDESWFHCVKGNHEQLLEDFLTSGPTGIWWFQNGGIWWNNMDVLGRDEVNRLLPIVQELPWVITVPTKDGRFHVVHAELSVYDLSRFGTLLTDKILEDEDLVKINCLTRVNDGEIAIWGRELWGPLYAQHLDERTRSKFRKRTHLEFGGRFVRNENLSRIFSGHTTLRVPCEYEGRVNLDTGAFRAKRDSWAGLTAAEPTTNKFWTTNFEGTRQVSLTVL